MKNTIPADFPFKSNFIDIKGNRMHYIDEGKGDPILFLHGNPTSSYLWRNIIPYLSNKGRCIALDLIGMGKSDKPNISYDFFDHYDYLKAFIEKLELKKITLIIHDWGSGLGFHYANEHRNNVKGIAFMEAIYKTWRWRDLSMSYRIMFKMIRTPVIGWIMVGIANMFVKQMLPNNIIRKLTKKEFENYAQSYSTIKSRKPIWVWASQIPLNGKPEKVNDVVQAYHDWLKISQVPKLCFYAHPGAIIKKEDVNWIVKNFPNTKSIDVGNGLHYIQEDQPHTIGSEIAIWYSNI